MSTRRATKTHKTPATKGRGKSATTRTATAKRTANTGGRAGSAFSENFRKDLYENLRDATYAAMYLKEALEEGDEAEFMVALADVVRAQGLGEVAERAGLHRVSVSKLLQPDRRPAFTSVHRVLEACGVDLTVRAGREVGSASSNSR